MGKSRELCSSTVAMALEADHRCHEIDLAPRKDYRKR
jgi:hypothetical protein